MLLGLIKRVQKTYIKKSISHRTAKAEIKQGFFLHTIANLLAYVICIYVVCVFCTRLMRPNKVETSRGLLTGCNELLYGTV